MKKHLETIQKISLNHKVEYDEKHNHLKVIKMFSEFNQTFFSSLFLYCNKHDLLFFVDSNILNKEVYVIIFEKN